MKKQQIQENQYQDKTLFNSIADKARDGIAESVNFLVSGGVFNGSAITFSSNGFTLTVTSPPTVNYVFGNGYTATAHGTVDGADTDVYTLDLSGDKPVSGSTTVYIVATHTTIQQDPVLISGPPQGHPDYNPEFTPASAYETVQDTIDVSARTSTANLNTTYIELGRVVINSSDTSLGAIDTSHQKVPALKSLTSIVTSFEGRNGAVTLQSGDVTGALGYTPVDKAGDTMTGNLTVDGAGGISTTVLSTSGNATIGGALTSSTLSATNSDARIKRNIKSMSYEEAHDGIMSLNPVDYQDTRDGHFYAGLIAQDVHKVFPKVVLVPEDKDALWSIDYSRLATYLIAGYQRQQRLIESLEQQLEDREQQVSLKG